MANIRTSWKSGFLLRGGVMRRETVWVEIAATNTALGAASTAVLFTGFSATLLALRPFTIVRTRGSWLVSSDQNSATETQMVALGMAVVSDQALAIGVTAVPTPFTDLSSDLFFLHEIATRRLEFITGIGAVWQVGMPFDSKAMRKVEEGADVALSIETSGVSDGANVSKSGRMLIKLH